jgi:hypothetical protein
MMLLLTETSERLMLDDSEKRIEYDLKVSGRVSMQGTNPALPQSDSMFVTTSTLKTNFTLSMYEILFHIPTY